MNNNIRKCVLLLSGGLDSAVTMLMAKDMGYEIYALTFDYGQKSRHEIKAAKKLVNEYNINEHKVIELDLSKFGGSALTDESIDVPEEAGDGIPSTYVPARNLIMLSVALSWGEIIGASSIFIGANVRDYSGYPDCRKSFLESFEKTADEATKAGTKLSVQAPLIRMSKSKIIQKGLRLGLDFKMTSSCYDPAPDGTSCGKCESCIIRKKGFEKAKKEDEKEKQ